MSQLCFRPPDQRDANSALDLQRQFQRSPYHSLRRLTCAVAGGRIVVRGRVPCFYMKQLAQTLAAKTVGLEQIESRIEVDSD